MTLENNVLEMENKVNEMGGYYLKGMGAIVDGIISNAELLLMREKDEKLSENAYKWLKEIKDCYGKIPFDSLYGKEEFYPLFVVKRLLPKFERSMDIIFKDKDKTGLNNLIRYSRSIIDVGNLYWEDMINLLKEIRKYPEAKDFRLKITDYKGMEWEF